ncbi:MAG: D-alanyl-D-alanine carboxypeptidase, partial [Thermodesulfobacteriota bacterium]
MTLYQCRGLFFSTLLAFLLFTLAAGDWSAARADSSKTKIRRGGYGLIQNGALTVSHQAEKLFVPASTIKILTADAALWLLGEDYRFTTRFFLTADNSLAIRGGGDPFLVSENIITIVRKLKEQGIDRINNLILDDFLFDISGPPEGSINSTNPYDSHNSALAVNFNSIAIYKKKNGTVSSDEQQTPT